MAVTDVMVMYEVGTRARKGPALSSAITREDSAKQKRRVGAAASLSLLGESYFTTCRLLVTWKTSRTSLAAMLARFLSPSLPT